MTDAADPAGADREHPPGPASPPGAEQMWRDLAPVGRSATSGGYTRLPYTSVWGELRAWFTEQATRRGLTVTEDGCGNTVAWWRPDGASGPAVLTGSHLDSVPDGGAYDGPLGVVAALAAIDRLRERGVAPTRPVGVAVFCEEEGSRFGLACLGSRLATGQSSWAEVRERRDADGVTVADALERAGLDPARGWLDLSGVGCFVELHVEQGRTLVHRERAVGAASTIWPHGRYRFDVTGRADHAGTTRMEDRADPMLTCAATVLAAEEQARRSGQRATVGRVTASPGAANAVPAHVSGWLDARAETEQELEALVDAVIRQAQQRAAHDGTTVAVTPESVTAAVALDPDLTARITADHDWPVIASQAGHDAGILAAAGIPAAMLFVRNPTGVSHAPDEHADWEDCLTGVAALTDTLARIAG